MKGVFYDGISICYRSSKVYIRCVEVCPPLFEMRSRSIWNKGGIFYSAEVLSFDLFEEVSSCSWHITS